MRRLRLLATAVAVAGLFAITAGSAAADSASHSYLLVAEEANAGVAANGETIHISCESTHGECGTFAVNPKAIEASGEFQHFRADGSLFAEGTWTATQLISYHSYGCGEVFGQAIPPNLCGGAVRFRAAFSTPIGELSGIITVFCVVGPNAPASIEHAFGEGVTVVVPGIVNFNHPAGGDNIFVQLS